VTRTSRANSSIGLVEKPQVLSHPVPQDPLSKFRENVVMRMVRKLSPLPFTVLMNLRYQHRLSLFQNPKRFTELLNRKKLHNRDPELTRTADKYAVREYVSAAIGAEYLVPMQQVVNRPEDIDWDSLYGRVVIKATHGCNMTMMLNTDARVDRSHVAVIANSWLTQSWYDMWKEWAYKDIPPRLIIENFIGEGSTPPPDYKIHVFNGTPELVQVDTDRFAGHKSMMFTADWQELSVGAAFELQEIPPKRPENLDKMLSLAAQLAKPFEYARIDFYCVGGRIYFGEITHYPGAVSVKFDPPSFDKALGDLWRFGTPIPAEYFARY
jgi:hypothetical protein